MTPKPKITALDIQYYPEELALTRVRLTIGGYDLSVAMSHNEIRQPGWCFRGATKSYRYVEDAVQDLTAQIERFWTNKDMIKTENLVFTPEGKDWVAPSQLPGINKIRLTQDTLEDDNFGSVQKIYLAFEVGPAGSEYLGDEVAASKQSYEEAQEFANQHYAQEVAKYNHRVFMENTKILRKNYAANNYPGR